MATIYQLNVGGLPIAATVAPAPQPGRFRVELHARTADIVAQRQAVLGLVASLVGNWVGRFVAPLVPTAPPAAPWTRTVSTATITCGPETTTVVLGAVDYATVTQRLLAYEAHHSDS